MEIAEKTQENNIHPQEVISSLQTQIDKQQQEITLLQNQVDWFKQQFKLASHRQFGKSSETSSSMNLTLFDEKKADDEIFLRTLFTTQY